MNWKKFQKERIKQQLQKVVTTAREERVRRIWRRIWGVVLLGIITAIAYWTYSADRVSTQIVKQNEKILLNQRELTKAVEALGNYQAVPAPAIKISL